MSNSIALIFAVDSIQMRQRNLAISIALSRMGERWHTSLWRRTRLCEWEWRNVESTTKGQRFHVRYFENEQVTKFNIERELGRLIKDYPFDKPKLGRLYVFMAGHGLPDDVNGSSVFCCNDYSDTNAFMTSYQLGELKERLIRIGIKHQAVHLDCCHAGGIFLKSRARRADYNAVTMAESPSVCAITAVSGDETSLEAKGNGLFTKTSATTSKRALSLTAGIRTTSQWNNSSRQRGNKS